MRALSQFMSTRLCSREEIYNFITDSHDVPHIISVFYTKSQLGTTCIIVYDHTLSAYKKIII